MAKVTVDFTSDTQGNGKTGLKYSECDPASKCPEWKNKANRRVYFKAK